MEFNAAEREWHEAQARLNKKMEDVRAFVKLRELLASPPSASSWRLRQHRRPRTGPSDSLPTWRRVRSRPHLRGREHDQCFRSATARPQIPQPPAPPGTHWASEAPNEPTPAAIAGPTEILRTRRGAAARTAVRRPEFRGRIERRPTSRLPRAHRRRAATAAGSS
jgi:hypothetical protein